MPNVTSLIKKKEKKFEKKITYPNLKEEDLKYFNYPKNYSLIGHAYEVLFQLKYLRKKNPRGIYILKAFKKRNWLKEYENINKVKKILNQLTLIEKRIYLKKETIRDILFLANVGLIRNPKKFKIEINKEDIRDLRSLSKSLKDFKNIMRRDLYFNVYVKKGNVKGEIDIVGDNFIIDIKTVKSSKITTYQINQLITYSLLLDKKIKKIGILFSRFGVLRFFKVKDLINQTGLKKIMGNIST